MCDWAIDREHGGKIGRGVRLILLHPEVAFRSCQDCTKYLYQEDGRVKRLTKNGPPCPRPAHIKTPCKMCPKIPLDVLMPSPGCAIELDEQTLAAYRFYQECRAVGHFPDDALVRAYARAIRQVEDEADRRREERKTIEQSSQMTLLVELLRRK